MKISLYVSPVMDRDKLLYWIAFKSLQNGGTIWSPQFQGKTKKEAIEKATAYYRGEAFVEANKEIVEIEI
jgi:hypothetical protein